MLMRHSIIYGIGNLIQATLAVGLIALYTRVLSKDDFGSYALVLTNVHFAYLLTINWMCVSFIRLYQKAEDPKPLLGTFLALFSLAALAGLAVTLVMIVFLETPEQIQLAVLGYLLFAARGWMELNMRLFQARLEAGRQARARIARSIVAALAGGGLVWMGWGPAGALIGAVLGTAGIGLYESVREWRGLPFGGTRAMRRQLWAFGMPLAISFALGSSAGFVGRYVMLILEGAAALGIYVLCHDLVSHVSNMITAPITAAGSSITTRDLEKSGIEAARRRLRQSCILLLGMIVPAAAGFGVIVPDLTVTVIGPDFRDGASAMLPFATFAIFMGAFRASYLDQAFHLGLKSHRMIWWNGIIIVVGLPLNYVLISRYGLMGAAYSMAVMAVISIILISLIGRTAFPLPFPWREIGKIVMAALLMAAAIRAIPIDPGIIGLIVKIPAGIAVYGFFVVLFDIDGRRTVITRMLRDPISVLKN